MTLADEFVGKDCYFSPESTKTAGWIKERQMMETWLGLLKQTKNFLGCKLKCFWRYKITTAFLNRIFFSSSKHFRCHNRPAYTSKYMTHHVFELRDKDLDTRDLRSHEGNLSSCENEQDSNTWRLRYRGSAPPADLSSQYTRRRWRYTRGYVKHHIYVWIR